MGRQESLSLKWNQRIERQRSLANNPRILMQHFQLFNAALSEYSINVSNIWNMDEKGFRIGIASRTKCVVRRGRRNPRITHDGNRELITVLEAISASGRVIPPMTIFKGAHHYVGWYKLVAESITGAVHGYSPNGYVDNDLAVEWLQKHFEPHTRPT
jgi:DDE superfamily endonuclease